MDANAKRAQAFLFVCVVTREEEHGALSRSALDEEVVASTVRSEGEVARWGKPAVEHEILIHIDRGTSSA